MYHLTPHYQYQRLISRLSLYGIPPNLYKLYPLSASLSLTNIFRNHPSRIPLYRIPPKLLIAFLLSSFPPLILVSLSHRVSTAATPQSPATPPPPSRATSPSPPSCLHLYLLCRRVMFSPPPPPPPPTLRRHGHHRSVAVESVFSS